VAFQRKKRAAIGIKAPFPGFIEPEPATSVDKLPSGQRWIHEVKFDGYRVQVHLRDAAVKVFTRRGNDWTNRFKKIDADAWHINAGSATIDGEVVVPAADVLQKELKGQSKKIVLAAFDLLYLNGYDLLKLALIERKALLKKIIADTDVRFSESFEVDGREMFKHACSVASSVPQRPAGGLMIPRYAGFDPDGVALTEADHFGNCPVCGAYIDMRGLDQVLAHVHDAEIEIGEHPEPPARERPLQ
jgi:hypothetical protein